MQRLVQSALPGDRRPHLRWQRRLHQPLHSLGRGVLVREERRISATAGAVGAAISNVVVYPLNVIVARLQTQTQKQKDGGFPVTRVMGFVAVGGVVDVLDGVSMLVWSNVVSP
jgi:hypothetical protein